MDDRKKGTEGTDDARLNEILEQLDESAGDAAYRDCQEQQDAADAAAFIRAQNTKLENAEVTLRAARKALESGAYHNAAIHMIDECLGDRGDVLGVSIHQTLIEALIELQRLVKTS